MQYTLIIDYKPNDFENSINDALDEGWALKGDTIILVIGNEITYFQPMVLGE